MVRQRTLLVAAMPALTEVEHALFRATLVVAGTLLLALSAKLQIPFWPVPMTMQSFVVLALAMAFGWRLGTLTVLLYLAQGAIGLQVFAGTPLRGSGLAYMAGPTGGYLLGFVAGALATGGLAERGWGRDAWRGAAAMALGHALIFFFGWAWLAVLAGPAKAYAAGVAPFYAATVGKTLLGSLTLPLAWKILHRVRGDAAPDRAT